MTPDSLRADDRQRLENLHAFILRRPQKNFDIPTLATALGFEPGQTERYLEYLADLAREYEPHPRFKGIARVFLKGQSSYEALSDNPDVRRDYDYRATNEGGRDFCPKNMFYYVWAWINLAEAKCKNEGLPNNQTVLLTHDCREYPQEIIEAARQAALLRGYKVVFAFSTARDPSCVSSYSHAVRLVKPVLAIFVTASHVSRPAENTVVGAKVALLGTSGQLESLSTKEIKVATAREISALKGTDRLRELVRPSGGYSELTVADSHNRLVTAGVLAVLGRMPGTSLHDLAQQLKTVPDIDAVLKELLPDSIPPVFSGLRIVIEGAHTSSGKLAEMAFSALGAETALLHGDVRRLHGLHRADPSIFQNLDELFSELEKRDAPLGMAFDLDGDRGALVLRNQGGGFAVLAPDRLGQVLIPFLMNEGGYSKAPKPLYVRDCLATDAIIDQGKLSGVAVETTDAGYVFLKRREKQMAKQGFLSLAMGEASGHAWLDYTGPFENPIMVALLFTALCIKRMATDGDATSGQSMPPTTVEDVFNRLAIPYRKSPRFQPLFSAELVGEAAKDPRNDTGWSPETKQAIPQKLISVCRSISILRLKEFFTPGKGFNTPLGELKVDRFDVEWDDEDAIFRFGKIYFSLSGTPMGSFVSRGSSNDPTAVQVWEVKEFEGATWAGQKLPESVIQQRFDLVGGLVLVTCEKLRILELTDRPPAANMGGVLPSVSKYREMMSVLLSKGIPE